MMWEREKGAPGHRSNGRCPGIDHLYANAGKVIDIARSDREIAADGYPGDLHVGRLERPTGAAILLIATGLLVLLAAIEFLGRPDGPDVAPGSS